MMTASKPSAASSSDAVDFGLRTPITDLFGIQFPLVAGGLQFLATADYAAACARAGIIGFLTSNHFDDHHALRTEIQRAQSLCGSLPFGVNIAMLPKASDLNKALGIARVVAEEGVRFVETTGRSPEPLLPILRDAGIKVLHKVPGLKFALKAQDIGVDAVTIVGWECGGHPGPAAVGTMVNAGLARERLDIPYLLGGGFGNGAQILAALATGASGVVMGTRFLASTEIPAHPDYKASLVSATENDTTISLWSVRNNARTLVNETTRAVAALEAADPQGGIDPLMPHIAGAVLKQTYQDGDTSRGMVYAGQALGFVRQSVPVAQTVSQLKEEFSQARQRLSSLFAPVGGP